MSKKQLLMVAISIKDNYHLITCSDTMKHGRDNSYKGMIVIY